MCAAMCLTPLAACRSVLVMYISYHGRQAACKGFFAFWLYVILIDKLIMYWIK